jgi:hypothetical protein
VAGPKQGRDEGAAVVGGQRADDLAGIGAKQADLSTGNNGARRVKNGSRDGAGGGLGAGRDADEGQGEESPISERLPANGEYPREERRELAKRDRTAVAMAAPPRIAVPERTKQAWPFAVTGVALAAGQFSAQTPRAERESVAGPFEDAWMEESVASALGRSSGGRGGCMREPLSYWAAKIQ